MFTQQRNHDLQEEFCQSLKSSVGVPHSVEENTRLYESALPFKDQCQPHNHASAFFLLGAVGIPKRDEWFDFQVRPSDHNCILASFYCRVFSYLTTYFMYYMLTVFSYDIELKLLCKWPLTNQLPWFQGRKLNYTNFESPTSLSYQRCVGLLVPPASGTWTGMSCKKTVKFCAACYERRPIVMRMRGLCEQTLEATLFRIEQELGKVTSLRLVIFLLIVK